MTYCFSSLSVGFGLNLYEGDIVLNVDDLKTVDQSEEGDIDGKEIKGIARRTAERQRQKLWQDRIIPYEIGDELSKFSDNDSDSQLKTARYIYIYIYIYIEKSKYRKVGVLPIRIV